jgi:hypothetical protein
MSKWLQASAIQPPRPTVSNGAIGRLVPAATLLQESTSRRPPRRQLPGCDRQVSGGPVRQFRRAAKPTGMAHEPDYSFVSAMRALISLRTIAVGNGSSDEKWSEPFVWS